MTNFAVLLDVSGVSNELDEAHVLSLTIITYAGCVISIVCLILSWITFQFLKSVSFLFSWYLWQSQLVKLTEVFVSIRYRNLSSDRNTIHKHLVFTLALAESLFLVAISPHVVSIQVWVLHSSSSNSAIKCSFSLPNLANSCTYMYWSGCRWVWHVWFVVWFSMRLNLHFLSGSDCQSLHITYTDIDRDKRLLLYCHCWTYRDAYLCVFHPLLFLYVVISETDMIVDTNRDRHKIFYVIQISFSVSHALTCTDF